jgi:FkbM family methyltransferase
MKKNQILFERRHKRSDALRSICNAPIRVALKYLRNKHIKHGRRKVGVCACDYISDEIAVDGLYELNELDTIFEFLTRHVPGVFDGAAIDIGANIGNHSLYFADYFQNVLSFEPHAQTFKLLELNSTLLNNITCIRAGISDFCGNVDLDSDPTNFGLSRIVDAETSRSQVIEVDALDHFVPKDMKVNLIKLDVEWHELRALRGCEKIIRANFPVILFEQQKDEFVSGSSPAIEFLRELGYQKFAVIERVPSAPTGWEGLRARIYNQLVRFIFGSKSIVVVKDNFEAGFYSPIIALPDVAAGKNLHQLKSMEDF